MKISYELAKKLKDARFPQPMSHGSYAWGKDNERVYIPTLSELIYACGEEFGALTKRNAQWVADCRDDHEEHIWFGSTPEEAVARLYIALHESAS